MVSSTSAFRSHNPGGSAGQSGDSGYAAPAGTDTNPTVVRPGAYRRVCIELKLHHLAVNTVANSSHLHDIEGGAGLGGLGDVAFGTGGIGGAADGAGAGLLAAPLDETTACAVAFRWLKVTLWRGHRAHQTTHRTARVPSHRSLSRSLPRLHSSTSIAGSRMPHWARTRTRMSCCSPSIAGSARLPPLCVPPCPPHLPRLSMHLCCAHLPCPPPRCASCSCTTPCCTALCTR